MVDTYTVAQLLKDPASGEGTGPTRGDRMLMYHDSRGIPTVGYGRNLQDSGISFQEAELLLANDIEQAERECSLLFFSWYSLPADCQTVLVCLCFNMGIAHLRTFTKMIGYVARGNYPKAADELLNSLWAHQVQPARRDLYVRMLRDCE